MQQITKNDPPPSTTPLSSPSHRTTTIRLRFMSPTTSDRYLGFDSSSLGKAGSVVSGMFERTSSFSSLPLQPNVSRTGEAVAGEGGFFMSGSIERGALSGPLDGNLSTAGSDQVSFSAPLSGMYARNKRKGISGMGKKFYKNNPERK